MPKAKLPNNSPVVITRYKSGDVPVRDAAPSRHAQQAREKADREEGFAVWWRNVRETQTLLPDDAEEGVDYIGALPYPALATLTALHAAYVAFVGVSHKTMDRNELKRSLSSVGVRMHGVRKVVLKIENSSRTRYRMEGFYAVGEMD